MNSTTSSTSTFEGPIDNMSCPICFEKYGVDSAHANVPLVFGCGHSVCRSCYRTIVKGDDEFTSIKRCPVCKAPFMVKELPINYALCAVIADKEKKRRRRRGIHRDHSFTESRQICRECKLQAPRNVFLFCSSCSTKEDGHVFCTICAYDNHRGHDVRKVSHTNANIEAAGDEMSDDEHQENVKTFTLKKAHHSRIRSLLRALRPRVMSKKDSVDEKPLIVEIPMKAVEEEQMKATWEFDDFLFVIEPTENFNERLI